MIFNAGGEKVWETGSRRLEAGKHVVQFDGSGLNSGVYFYTLEVGGVIKQTNKMVLVK